MIYDIVQNFLIALTLAAGRIRFDGLLKQISHREYFLDAIGKCNKSVSKEDLDKYEKWMEEFGSS